MNKSIIIYTDGACRGNPGPGGWGALLCYNDNKKEIFGGESDTTNNRMELTAAIEALNSLKDQQIPIELFTDSKYLKDGVEKWLIGWKKNGWRTAAKKPVKNSDLWKQIDELNASFQIEWKWVKGHSGDPGNEAADVLANKGIDSLN